MPATPFPRSLANGGDALVIEWNDAITHRISWKMLRDSCPCATCRTDRAKPPVKKPLLAVLSPAEARPLVPVAIKPVGNYAYGITFSDGHNSGIYSLDFLRELGQRVAMAGG